MVTIYLLFSIAFLLLAFLVFRVKYRKDYTKCQRLTLFSSIMGVIIIAIHANSIYLILPTKWPYLPSVMGYQIIKIIFIVMLVIGIIILLISWFKLGTRVSMGADKNKLQTDGLYKYSRNPQLVGYGFILASFTLRYFSYLVLIWFLNYIIASCFMVKSEEEFLNRKYKEEYKDYCKRVPRFG